MEGAEGLLLTQKLTGNALLDVYQTSEMTHNDIYIYITFSKSERQTYSFLAEVALLHDALLAVLAVEVLLVVIEH